MAISKLREWRKANGLSAREFASLAKTSDATVIRLENGKQSPSFDLLKRVCAATGGVVTPNDFMPEETATPAE